MGDTARATRPANDPPPAVLFEEVVPVADGIAATEARVVCPCCSQRITVGLDPGGGASQRYSEACPVCCRALLLAVAYAGDGSARVTVQREDAT
ncbi:MAG: CPXCG motif-containing cysteine-rich protein [Gemmatimonadota bacterium]|nr:CPXCG motif-containing cysteine-rich protein [Gemmatimonadota bacterium]